MNLKSNKLTLEQILRGFPDYEQSLAKADVYCMVGDKLLLPIKEKGRLVYALNPNMRDEIMWLVSMQWSPTEDQPSSRRID